MWITPEVSILFPTLLLKMKTMVIINKTANTSTARKATIAPATSSPRLFDSDTSIGRRGSVVTVSAMLSSGPIGSTVGRGEMRIPLSIPMLLGIGRSGSFVGRGACVVSGETVVIVIEDKVMLGEIEPALTLTVGLDSEVMRVDVERDGTAHG